jgi:DNA polymerase-1
MEVFLVLDGTHLFYRAYYSIPPLKNKAGLFTHATFGFTRVLLKLIKKEKPTYLALCFDRAEPTFRHQKYEAYKAQREKMPEELVAQIPLLKKIVSAFQIPLFEVPGFEADDIMATLAQKAKPNLKTILVSGDKDLFQLITENVKVLFNQKGISEFVLYDLEKLKEIKKLTPEQIPEIIGLRGDPSDNIPGVKGIGEKTALKLICDFGSVEKIYENIYQVYPLSLRNKLIPAETSARLSRELAVLKKDVPLENFTWEACLFTPNYELLKKIFLELEFNSLLAELEKLKNG